MVRKKYDVFLPILYPRLLGELSIDFFFSFLSGRPLDLIS